MMRARWLLSCGSMALIVGAILFPFYLAVVASLSPEAELFETPRLLPFPPLLDHYRALFVERNFWLPIRNSLVVAGTTTAVCLAIGTPCAYALARLEFTGRRILLGVILAISMFPQISILSPLYLILRALGLLDTYPGLVLPYLTFAMPLGVWLLTSFIRQLPLGVEEAARMDGASRVRTLVEIVLPMTAPAIGTTAILTFIYAWNEFLFALAFTLGPERQTVPVAIALFRGQYQIPWGQILAAAIVTTAPVAALVLGFQRRIVQGLITGAQ